MSGRPRICSHRQVHPVRVLGARRPDLPAVDDEATKKGDKSATSVKAADGEKQKSRETKPLKPVVLAEAKKPTSNAKSARAMSMAKCLPQPRMVKR